jgi:SAM-dependent methyltransferase
MAHETHFQYFDYIRGKFPSYFENTKVLDVGSLNINGCNKPYFSKCDYYGLDVAPGPNVNIVSIAHEYSAPDESYDVLTSANAFEHDMHFEKTFLNMIRLVKSGGLLFFTCAGEGYPEHGTASTTPNDAPFLMKNSEWKNYYKNITEEWIRSFVDVDSIFSSYEFSYLPKSRDQRFWGIKK